MSVLNQFEIQTQVRAALMSDPALTAWIAANYSDVLTILLGNRPLKEYRPEQYPLIVVVFDPQSVGEKVRNTTHWMIEDYHFEIGLYQTDVELALQHLAELELLTTTAALTFLRGLTASDEHAEVVARIGDADVNHPYHFIGVKIQMRRHASY